MHTWTKARFDKRIPLSAIERGDNRSHWRNSLPEQPRNVSRIQECEACAKNVRNLRWRWERERELTELKSHVNHPGNCRICRTRSVKTMALLANRKKRQLGEIADNFEVPDEAYRRVARCPFSVNPWVTVLGEYDDYMDHLVPAINTFAPSCRALSTCGASKYASIRWRLDKNIRDRLSESPVVKRC